MDEDLKLMSEAQAPAPEERTVMELVELPPVLVEAVRQLRWLRDVHGHAVDACACRLCRMARAPLVEAECLDLVYTLDPL